MKIDIFERKWLDVNKYIFRIGRNQSQTGKRDAVLAGALL
ncbi:hypothetical protein HMPREF0548_0451 [Lactobacillus ultunensis DSM 16047]|uniref:Uncharacterized protein n=1 Tax=Lactobacillus ultunensis DSM 16047 TaxID=525365 RepID=C2ELA5_9LACO|nr:hypothetical protein HMPREF0548_0451 [Lactobacillus ultunensis DSM 16047]